MSGPSSMQNHGNEQQTPTFIIPWSVFTAFETTKEQDQDTMDQKPNTPPRNHMIRTFKSARQPDTYSSNTTHSFLRKLEAGTKISAREVNCYGAKDAHDSWPIQETRPGQPSDWQHERANTMLLAAIADRTRSLPASKDAAVPEIGQRNV